MASWDSTQDIIYGATGQMDGKVRNMTHRPLLLSEWSHFFVSCDLFILFSEMIAEKLLNTCCFFQRGTNYMWSKANQALHKTKDKLSLIVFILCIPDSKQSVGRECGQWFCGYLLHAATRYVLLYDTLLPFTPDRFWLHRLFKPPEPI